MDPRAACAHRISRGGSADVTNQKFFVSAPGLCVWKFFSKCVVNKRQNKVGRSHTHTHTHTKPRRRDKKCNPIETTERFGDVAFDPAFHVKRDGDGGGDGRAAVERVVCDHGQSRQRRPREPPPPFGQRFPRQLKVLEEAAPDLLCMQELHRDPDDVAHQVAKNLGHEIVTAAVHTSGTAFGQTIGFRRSRFFLKQTVRYWLSRDTRPLAADGKPVRFTRTPGGLDTRTGPAGKGFSSVVLGVELCVLRDGKFVWTPAAAATSRDAEVEPSLGRLQSLWSSAATSPRTPACVWRARLRSTSYCARPSRPARRTC